MKSLSPEANAFLSSYGIQHPGRIAYSILAEHFPKDLLALIESKELEPHTLTFAAEIAGGISDSQGVRKALLPLLSHPSLLVQEGAMLGIVHHMNKEIVQIFRQKANSEVSELARLAQELLEEINLEILL